ncbi:glucosamine-6-phosphate isomerases/6-phosphogluconolactonase family protein, partial [Chlamydia psittaci 84-8471/1]
RLQKAITAKQ